MTRIFEIRTQTPGNSHECPIRHKKQEHNYCQPKISIILMEVDAEKIPTKEQAHIASPVQFRSHFFL